MDHLRVPETSDSPEINLEKERGRFEIIGKSLPEDPNEFYNPVISWVAEYVRDPNPETEFTFKLDYFNTASSKKILDIIMTLKEIMRKKKSVIVKWFYRKNDDDMFDTAETFSEISGVPFKIIPY